MHLRRSTALTLGTMLLCAPALTACGFNYATDRVNTISNGATNREGTVDVLSGVVVSAADNSGTFVASLSNNNQDKAETFESIAGAAGNTFQPGDFSPITIPPGGFVNLATDGGVPLTGTFVAGDFLPVTVNFDNGESVTLNVPIVTDTGEYAGLDVTAAAATGTPPPTPNDVAASGASGAVESSPSSTPKK